MSYTPFKQLSAQLAKKPGVTDADALTASIAARKYGRRAVQKAAGQGASLKHHKALASYMTRHR